jgi:hypothetical protein
MKKKYKSISKKEIKCWLVSFCFHNFISSVYLFYEIVFHIFILLFNYVLKCLEIKLEPFYSSHIFW